MEEEALAAELEAQRAAVAALKQQAEAEVRACAL
jgi:hypothetical protein